MLNKIAITEDLADLFVALSLQEGYCTFHNREGDFAKKEANYILNYLERHQKCFSDMFSMLTNILILYDNIELPVLNPVYNLKDNITSIANGKNEMPRWFYGIGYPSPFEEDVFPDELAIPLRPFVINHCLNAYQNPDYFTQFAVSTTGSLKNFYGQIFDRYYNRKNLIMNLYIKDLLDTNFLYYYNEENPIEYKSDRGCVSLGFERIQTSLQHVLLIQNIAKQTPCDFYTPSFSNFHSTTNTNDAYCILKSQISMIIEEQPAFESLTDILLFRDRKQNDIAMLRNEVSVLEALLIQGGEEQAIQRVISDVRSANQSLLKNTPAKRAAKLATYLSVPISLLEMYTFGTSYSMAIGVVGTVAQLIADYSDSKSNWLFVAR